MKKAMQGACPGCQPIRLIGRAEGAQGNKVAVFTPEHAMNGKTEIHLMFPVSDIADVVICEIERGLKTQAGLAADLGISEESFSKKYKDPANIFYECLRLFMRLETATGQHAGLEYMARQRGFTLTKLNGE